MKPEIAKLWTDALLSGEYKQTQHKLNCSGGMCCLGVLTDLYHKATEDGEWVDLGEMEGVKHFVIDEDQTKNCTYLPPRVQNWAGIGNHSGRIIKGTEGTREDPSTDLAYQNDRGKTFQQIAELIKLNVEIL